MNWLIYIGGGWIFLLWVLDKIVGLKITLGETGWQMLLAFLMTLMSVFSAILVWIWICWRFIK